MNVLEEDACLFRQRFQRPRNNLYRRQSMKIRVTWRTWPLTSV